MQATRGQSQGGRPEENDQVVDGTHRWRKGDVSDGCLSIVPVNIFARWDHRIDSEAAFVQSPFRLWPGWHHL